MTPETLVEAEGFAGYVPDTLDPGKSVLIATIVICILLNALLPCLVSIGQHREKKRNSRIKTDPWAVNASDDVVQEFTPEGEGGGHHDGEDEDKSILSASDASTMLKSIRKATARSLHGNSLLTKSAYAQSVASSGTRGSV